MFTFRDLETPEEMEMVATLEKEVWQMEDLSVVPYQMMLVIMRCGGHLVGAFDGDKMVGFAMGLAARQPDGWRLWSHMAGVLNEYRGQGVGFGLKQRQRTWALAHDYPTIGWTFDPLQRVNANFNLRRLGAQGVLYHVNAYGEMRDGLNRHMPSDRLEVSWDLSRAPMVDHADNEPHAVLTETHDEHFLVQVGADNEPIKVKETASHGWYFVEIPYDIAQLKATRLETALKWRYTLRDVLGNAFAQGYRAVDFVNSDKRCWYVLFK